MQESSNGKQLLGYLIALATVFIGLFLFVPQTGGQAIVKAMSGAFILSALPMAAFSWTMSVRYFWIFYTLNTVLFFGIIFAFMIMLTPPHVEYSRILWAVWVDSIPYFEISFLLSIGLNVMKLFTMYKK